MNNAYQKIITSKGLKVCPFCGKAVSITFDDSYLKNPIVNLKLEHSGFDNVKCVFYQIERIVQDEDDIRNFLDKWNRRQG